MRLITLLALSAAVLAGCAATTAPLKHPPLICVPQAYQGTPLFVCQPVEEE